jgi:hypothetical protein
VKFTMTIFPGRPTPLTRVQLRSLLTREAYPLVASIAKQRDDTVAMTADFLRAAFPRECGAIRRSVFAR